MELLKQKFRDKYSYVLELLWMIVLGVIVFCIFIRCKYSLGYNQVDEYVQLASINRYIHGDIPIIDDWSASTMLSGLFLGSIFKALNLSIPSILISRYLYVVFQLAISFAVYISSKEKGTAFRLAIFAYICSTPYCIIHITYNTISIGMILLFCVLFFAEFKRFRVVLAGFCMSIAVMVNVYSALIYLAFFFLVLILNKKKIELLSWKRFFFLSLGIAIVFIPFLIFMIRHCTFEDFYRNLSCVLSDAEYTETALHKLVFSQYKVIRTYWRAWLPLCILDVLAICAIKCGRDYKKEVWIVGSAIIAYAVFRFAFIYGSISINLAVVPVFFWAVQAIVLARIYDIKMEGVYYYIGWLICGYCYCVCEYLATDTGILTTSAMFIVIAIPSFVLNYKFFIENCDKTSMRFVFISVASVYIICLLVLRMTFIWGDERLLSCRVRIEDGIANGIYTSEESAESYHNAMNILDKADINPNDKTLILPMNPIYYCMIDSYIAAPYIFRFLANVDELGIYYDLHRNKMPDVVVIALHDSAFGDYDIEACKEYFAAKGYRESYSDESVVVLKN